MGRRELTGDPTTRHPLVLAFETAVSLGILAFLVLRVDWSLLGTVVHEIQLGFVLGGLAMFLALTAVEVERLKAALGPLGLTRRRAWRLHVIGAFFASFLPGQVGGDLYRLHHLGRVDGSLDRPIPLLLFLRLVGLTVVTVASGVALLLSPEPFLSWLPAALSWRPAALTLPTIFLAIVIGGLLAFSYNERTRRRARLFLLRTRRAFAALGMRGGACLVGLSVLVVVCRALILLLLSRAVGFPLQVGDAVVVVGMATIATNIPVSLAGLGVREAAIVGPLVLLGQAYERAVVVALLSRAVTIPVVVWGALWRLRRPARPLP